MPRTGYTVHPRCLGAGVSAIPSRRAAERGKAPRRMVPASIEGLLMAITSPHVRLAPAVQEGLMTMVHGRDRLHLQTVAIAAGRAVCSIP